MGDDDRVETGCLLGFGFSFGVLLAIFAMITVFSAVLVGGCIFVAGLADLGGRRIEQIREQQAQELEAEPLPRSIVEHPPVTSAEPSRDSPHQIVTQAGVKGYLLGRKGTEVEMLIADGTTTWVQIHWLTEDSQQTVHDALPDAFMDAPR